MSLSNSFQKEINKCDDDSEIEFCWYKEYILAILLVKNDDILHLIENDLNDDFWIINI